MSISDKIGAFNWLSIWDLGPVAAFFVAWGVQFAAVNLLMVPEGHFGRGRWLNFLTNNGVLLPLYAAMVTLVLRKAGSGDAWYTESWWHWICLVVPVVGWILIDHPNYLPSQLITPSKLGHTLAVIPMGYWLAAPAPALLATFRPVGAAVIALMAIVGALWFWLGPWAGHIVYFTNDKADPHVKLRFLPCYEEWHKQAKPH